MMRRKLVPVLVPFTGFYDSPHSDMLDDALRDLAQDDNGDPMKGSEDLWQYVRQWVSREAYAKLYVEAFSEEMHCATGIPCPLTFVELLSPREYNFTTDKILALVPQSTILHLYELVDKEALNSLIRTLFTSYSGFQSSYPNNLNEWGPLVGWDAVKNGTLLNCVWNECSSSDASWDLMEGYRCNGYLANIVADSLTPAGEELLGRLTEQRLRAQEGE